MIRAIPVFVLSVLLLLCVSCEEEVEKAVQKPVDSPSKEVLALRGDVDLLKEEVAVLRLQNVRLRAQMQAASEEVAKSLANAAVLLDVSRLDMVDSDALGDPSVALLSGTDVGVNGEVGLAAGGLDAKDAERRGWPWFIRLILVLAIVLICFLLYKRVVNEAEEADDEVVKENDLGSIRYPGSMRE